MTMSEQVEVILGETVSALARLQTDDLEELEKRLTLISGTWEPGSVKGTRSLQVKMEMLQACLNITAENLTVLHRLRGRGVRGGGVNA